MEDIRNIIVNADDFGLNSSVNKAIIESFNLELINSTTIMANMPFFEEAIELAHKNKITKKIGIHLNIDAGNHLTSKLRNTRFFNKDNQNRLKNRIGLFFLTREEKNIIHKEFSAQIERVKKHGINITHIDSHHHIHEIWPITKIILSLLRVHNISAMRILNNLNISTRFYKLEYRKQVNQYIKTKDSNFSDFFGNQLDVLLFLNKHPTLYLKKKIEVMVHPGFNSKGIIVDQSGNHELNLEFPKTLLNQTYFQSSIYKSLLKYM